MAGRRFTKTRWVLAFLLVALVCSGLYFVFFAYRVPDIIVSDPLLGSVVLDQFLLSPNFDPKNPMAKLLLLPGGAKLARFVEGQYYEWEPQNRVQEIYWTTRYPSSALVTMEIMVSGVSKLDLSKVQVPILVVYSEDDQVVNPAETEKAFARLGAIKKEIVVFNSSADRFHHVLAGNILSPGTVEPLRKLIVDFIRRAKARGVVKATASECGWIV
jgi:pimeloyl-ACP methyl ester carboxylesterase